jgi:hypothetical protein
VLRLLGALARAAFVLVILATPALLLPDVSRSSLEITLIAGALVAILVLVEYSAAQPGFIDFRFAPPYNRGRFVILATILLALSFLCRAAPQTPGFGQDLQAFADRMALWLDFPLSPVRLAAGAVEAVRDPALTLLIRRATALAFTISVAGLVFLTLVLWLFTWPQGRRKFNLWINLPTFVPATGRGVERRLIWGGAAYVAAGLTLPFTLVVLSSRAIGWLSPQALAASLQTLVWVVAIWAFLPASLVIRGAALLKVGWLVRRARAF